MTELERKATEYADNKTSKGNYDYAVGDNVYYSESALKLAYIAGAKENGVVWHDLRKNPQDLPKAFDKSYLLCFRGGKYYRIGFLGGNGLRFICFGGDYNDVIAWCEIPQFEEQD